MTRIIYDGERITRDELHHLTEHDLLGSDWQQDYRTHSKTLIVDGEEVRFAYHRDMNGDLEDVTVQCSDDLRPRVQALMLEHLEATGLTPRPLN